MVSRPPTEEELVERAKRGDEDAYEELVRAYQGIAFRTAYLVAGNAADAEDAAQEGFVKAHRALGRFRRGAPFRPWLLQIVANEARNRRRSAGRRAASRPARGRGRILGGRGSVPRGGSARRARSKSACSRRSTRLREEERLVIACRYFLELSEEETAAALGVRIGTVKSRTSRALEHLRETYA